MIDTTALIDQIFDRAWSYVDSGKFESLDEMCAEFSEPPLMSFDEGKQEWNVGDEIDVELMVCALTAAFAWRRHLTKYSMLRDAICKRLESAGKDPEKVLFGL